MVGVSGDDNRIQRDITIRVDETRMSISIPMDEVAELCLRNAAKKVNELLSQYRQHFPEASKEDTLAYVALHCARDYFELEHLTNSSDTEQRLSSLLNTLEDTLT